MKSHELVEHTADVRLIVKADSLKELFEAALEGMAELLLQGNCTKKDLMQAHATITLDAPNATILLIDFLSVVLTQTQINRTIYCTISFQELGETHLSASLQGTHVNRFDEDIKSVTYHEAEIKKK